MPMLNTVNLGCTNFSLQCLFIESSQWRSGRTPNWKHGSSLNSLLTQTGPRLSNLKWTMLGVANLDLLSGNIYGTVDDVDTERS